MALIKSSFFVFLLVVIFISLSEVDCGKTDCADGHRDGEQYSAGGYLYTCKNGVREPRGCLNGGSEVLTGGTYDDAGQNVRMECVLGADGYLTVQYKCCSYQGREVPVGSTYNDGTTAFTCKKSGGTVQSVASGCVADGGRELSYGQTVVKGETVYKCREATSGKSEMTKAGCAPNGGQKVAFGKQYDDGSKFVYTCSDSGMKKTGCLHQSSKFADGDQYNDGTTVFECQVRGSAGAETDWKAVECVGHNDAGVVEYKKPDCVWDEAGSSSSDLFKVRCEIDSTANKATVKQISCIHKHPQGVFTVNPGCYYSSAGITVGCFDLGGYKLDTRVSQGESAPSGLRKC